MIDVSLLNPGDRIRIVDAWPTDGSAYAVRDMNRFLGKTVTVTQQGYGRVHIQEDGERWNWYPGAIERKVPNIVALGIEDII